MTDSPRAPIHERLDAVTNTLGQILAQTTATNGKVIRLNEEVFGDLEHQTPGLKTQMADIHRYIADQKAVGRAVKFALPVLGIGNIGTLVVVAYKSGLFG